MRTLRLGHETIKKLPYLTKAGKIFFATATGKQSYLYTKHGMGFTNNLIQLLDDLQTGKVVKVWFTVGLSGQVEIFLNRQGKLKGSFSSTDEFSFNQFEKF